MKRTLTVLILTAVFTVVFTVAVSARYDEGFVNAYSVHLRSSPDSSRDGVTHHDNVIGTLSQGYRVVILADVHGWLRVRHEWREGYIWNAFITIDAVYTPAAVSIPNPVFIPQPIPTPTPAQMPAPEPIPAPEPTPVPVHAATGLRGGDNIMFSDYEWRVLDIQGDRALIITNRVIELSYDLGSGFVTWEENGIRQWLNREFLGSFASQDRIRIAETYVINNDNPWFGTFGGNNTTDRIFLLSTEEVVLYFGDSGSLSNRPIGAVHFDDEFSLARIALTEIGANSRWYLRSPGSNPSRVTFVCFGGSLRLDGHSYVRGIRPALWLYL